MNKYISNSRSVPVRYETVYVPREEKKEEKDKLKEEDKQKQKEEDIKKKRETCAGLLGKIGLLTFGGACLTQFGPSVLGPILSTTGLDITLGSEAT